MKHHRNRRIPSPVASSRSRPHGKTDGIDIDHRVHRGKTGSTRLQRDLNREERGVAKISFFATSWPSWFIAVVVDRQSDLRLDAGPHAW
jgi:hypothetical protein